MSSRKKSNMHADFHAAHRCHSLGSAPASYWELIPSDDKLPGSPFFVGFMEPEASRGM